MATTAQPHGLALDLLAYRIQGRVRSTLLSGRSVLTPASGTIINAERVLEPSSNFQVPIPAGQAVTAMVVRSTAPVKIDAVLARTGGDVTLPQLNCDGLFVLTDTVKTLTISNLSTTSKADVCVVFI